jgi:uncharacterized membrane protein YgcG
MAMTTTSAQSSSFVSSLPAAGFGSSTTIRLDRTNFLLWKTQTIPNIAGQGYLGYLDGSLPAPPQTITTGTGKDAVTVPNPRYHDWWLIDQRVMGVLLGSMTEDVLAQMIGRTTSASVWRCLTSMFSAQGRASIRAYRRKLTTTRRNDMGAADYYHLMKGFADAMATVGAPLPDDELIDYILAGLGEKFASLQSSLNVYSNANPDAAITLTDFYAMLVSAEAMQDQTAHELDYSTSANAARRNDYGRTGGGGRSSGGQGSGYQGGGGYQAQGGGSHQGGGYHGGGHQGGGYQGGGYQAQGGGHQGGFRNDGRTGGGQGSGGQNRGRNGGGGRRRLRYQ